MSGHSKFANIKHKKEKNDAAKGKIFTKIGKEIAVAVKEGGSSDPSNNSRLRDVIAKAKSNNMPNDTIERNIKRASGDMSAANYEHITYEGYGPNGTAIIVETLTDNKNRTASNVKNAFTKGSGNVGTPGCVSFMFDKKGQIVIDKEEYEGDADELMMQVLDAGAEDFVEEEDSFEVLTDPDDFSAVRLAMEEAGIPMASAEVTMIPQTYVELTDAKDIANIQKTLDMLDGDEAGLKSVTIQVNGENAYGYLKSEKGVHRLVRISPFNAAGKRQTSFASCDVMPDIEEDLDVEINDDDIRIDTYRSSGAGGQHINKTSSAVRITHNPTGIVVQCQNERSQLQNKDKAMKMLKAKLYVLKKQEEEEKRSGIRGEVKEIGWGSQIRSYVMQPYTMVKDHRTNQEITDVGKVMDGYIDPFINAYLKWINIKKDN